jgi:hypothetical protein
VTIKNAIFWGVMPCRSCLNRRFGGKYRLHLHGRIIRERGTGVGRWLQIPEDVILNRILLFLRRLLGDVAECHAGGHVVRSTVVISTRLHGVISMRASNLTFHPRLCRPALITNAPPTNEYQLCQMCSVPLLDYSSVIFSAVFLLK